MRLNIKRIYLFSQKNVKSRGRKSYNFKGLSFYHDFTTSIMPFALQIYELMSKQQNKTSTELGILSTIPVKCQLTQ